MNVIFYLNLVLQVHLLLLYTSWATFCVKIDFNTRYFVIYVCLHAMSAFFCSYIMWLICYTSFFVISFQSLKYLKSGQMNKTVIGIYKD